MLRAYLHRKLGRVQDGEDAFCRLEDPLTSSVFERFAYLPIEVVWEILRRTARACGTGTWPECPMGRPAWSFWPSWVPAGTGVNVLRVEPDVVLRFVDDGGNCLGVVIFEAKHRGDQYAWQRREQVAAARMAWPAARVIHVAIGGTHARALEPQPGGDSFEVSWPALRTVLARVRDAEPHVATLLGDIAAALDRWGYGPRTHISSLVEAHRGLSGLPPDALAGWQPAAPVLKSLWAGLGSDTPFATSAKDFLAWRPT